MDRRLFKTLLGFKIPARWHMTLICLTTIASGVLFSKWILFFHLAEPAIRYGTSVLLSYVVFFVLIYFWLRLYFGGHLENSRTKSSATRDALDDLEVISRTFDGSFDSGISRAVQDAAWQGQGGQFSGGGASLSWDTAPSGGITANSDSMDLGTISSAGDFDDGIVFVLLIGALAAVFGSAGYIIYQAPEILFEAAFEVALAAGLFRRTKNIGAEGWQYSIFKRTWWIFALVLIASMTFGFVIKSRCPEATSFAQYQALCSGKSNK